MTSNRFSPALMLGLGALILPAAAQAQSTEDTGPYGSLRLGASATEDFDLTAFAPAGTFFFGEGSTGECGEGCQSAAAVSVPAGSDTLSLSVETDTGFAIAGALGYDFGMVRAEVEGSWTQNDISGIVLTGASAGGDPIEGAEFDLAELCDSEGVDCDEFFGGSSFGDAKVRQLGAMANLWLDIPLGQGFEPYVGGGVGVVDVKITDIDGDSETLFSWQLGAGVAIPVGEKMKVTVDYRHRETDRPDFGSTSTEGIAAERIKTDAVFAGLRFYF
jgi:opacity protein-like surface antigen